MFKTIKSKILLIVLSVLIVLVSVLLSFGFLYYKSAENLIINANYHSIAVLAQNINKEVIKINDNAYDLALLGEIQYESNQNKKAIENIVVRIFEIYKDSLGGGIWFEPYVLDKNKRLSCIYAFRNKQNQVVIDESFESEQYDYLNQSWYKEISSKLSPENNVAWSSPYYENQGSETLMITAGSGIYHKGKLVGISTVDWEFDSILDTISKIKPTSNSFTLFADRKNDYILVSTDKYLNNADLIGKSLSEIPWYNDNLKQIRYYSYHNKVYIPYVKVLDNDMILIVNIPKWELFRLMIIHVVGLCALLIIISLIFSVLLYHGLNKNVIRPIDKLTDIANKIGKGDADIKIDIAKPEEFAHLAATFDKMTNDIKTMTKQQTRILSELSIAKSIQESSLPVKFPPFPDIKEFDIYASMVPAKEVGGDFYDFYFLDEEYFMFLVADVSGKGIPAALFMMTVKTLISNVAQVKCHPKEFIEKVNKKLCENNKEGFFVTMLACIVNIYTGEIFCINCGHNPPLIKRNNGVYEYLKLDSNIVLGVIDKAEYNIYETKFNKGDKIFIYTDGITEAINENDELYGEQRLVDCLNNIKNEEISNIIKEVKASVDGFTQNMEQSDDETMLIFEYNGKSDVKTFKDIAIKDNYKKFYTWLHSVLNEWSVDDNLMNKIDMCCEEIYANIAFYAYEGRSAGNIEVALSKWENEIIVNFMDEGAEYNPLEKPDPDITLDPKERPLGGLGIFMVKQMADDIYYERKDFRNKLTIKFNIT